MTGPSNGCQSGSDGVANIFEAGSSRGGCSRAVSGGWLLMFNRK